MQVIVPIDSFRNRSELDAFIGAHWGKSAENNRNIVIEGSREEFENLALSEKDTVYGVRIRFTDDKTLKKDL